MLDYSPARDLTWQGILFRFMRDHTIKLSDDELRMLIIGLDLYAEQWRGYASRRKRSSDAMRGVRVNSVDEKRLLELMRSDVLAAYSLANHAEKLRDHLARILGVSGAK